MVDLKKCIECKTVLPLVPVCRLYEDYTAIITEYRSCLLSVIEFFKYFYCNLLNNDNVLFKKEIWSYSNNFWPRTNSSLKEFHSKINRLINKPNPNCYEVINVLKKIMISNLVELLWLMGGGPKIARKESIY